MKALSNLLILLPGDFFGKPEFQMPEFGTPSTPSDEIISEFPIGLVMIIVTCVLIVVLISLLAVIFYQVNRSEVPDKQLRTQNPDDDKEINLSTLTEEEKTLISQHRAEQSDDRKHPH